MGYLDIYKLQSISGANAKQDFLREHSEDKWFCKFLYFALNPMITYNISDKTLRELMVPNGNCVCSTDMFKNIFECCEYLSSKNGVTQSDIYFIRDFLIQTNEDKEIDLYIKLLSKTLRLGVTAKTVNKTIPDLIPEWEVQQAYPIDKYPIKNGTEFWLTQKLNGVRATYYDGKMIARSGVPYKGIEHIIQSIEHSPMAGYILDGELTLIDKGELSDNEAFRVATGILNSDDMNKTAICYTVFDILPLEDFDSSKPSITYSKRRELLDIFSDFVNSSGCLRIIPVLYHGTDKSKIEIFLEQMVNEDKEGLMLNTNVPYKRTRHKGILKIKRFYTMDLQIIGSEEGTGRLSGTLGALMLKYKDNIVKVGSGFSDEQRQEYWKSKDELNGTLCEVKYKEISSDKNTGLESLQFPVFVRLRNDKTDVSYG